MFGSIVIDDLGRWRTVALAAGLALSIALLACGTADEPASQLPPPTQAPTAMPATATSTPAATVPPRPAATATGAVAAEPTLASPTATATAEPSAAQPAATEVHEPTLRMAQLFTLPSAPDGMPVSLESYRGEKNVVLVFYRGFW